jgi:dienelactone hydrolase
MMVAHGGEDPFSKPEDLTNFIAEMNKAGAYYRIHIYSGAKHSFTNPAADEYGAKFNLPLQYNADADRDSWQAMQEFLQAAFSQ